MRLYTVLTNTLLLVTALTLSNIVLAGDVNRQQEPIRLAAGKTHHGTGTVMEIDKEAGKVKLDHGPVKSIGWMSMKMAFDVEDAAMLDGIKAGDKVGFNFVETRDKRFVVTDIEVQ